MKAYVVLTTINVPYLIQGYLENLHHFHHENEVGIIIIGDLKTPPETREFVQALTGKSEVIYADVPAQEKWLRRFPDLKNIIPYNSDNRRNIGFLMALERGAEFIISIDDDNFVTDQDFYGEHSIVGKTQEFQLTTSSTGWFNNCQLMETLPPRTIYPRGFPYSLRWIPESNSTIPGRGRVVINAGLWLKAPDVDAITRLGEPVETVALKIPRVTLAPGVWCPINTQNTAVHRDAIAAYYFVVMGLPFNGLKLDRFGDIWSGYFSRKVVDHMGDLVTMGTPLTLHQRNAHDLFKDLREELGAIMMTEELLKLLAAIHLHESTYAGAYVELLDSLCATIQRMPEYQPEVKAYFTTVRNNGVIWVDTVAKVLG